MPVKIQRTGHQSVSVESLTPSAFAPFGTVIQNPGAASFPTPLPSVEANQGSATKYPDVSPLISSYRSAQPARPRITLFSCRPRAQKRNKDGQQVFDVSILERHPFTPQTFVPTGLSADDKQTAYLVIVAPTLSTGSEFRILPVEVAPSDRIALSTATPKSTGPPDLKNLKAFIARGDQAVTYGAGTWHAPMVVLGKQTIDFVVVQYMNGVPDDDCQEAEFYGGSLDVVIEDGLLSQRVGKL